VPQFGAQVITCLQRTKRFGVERLIARKENNARDVRYAGQAELVESGEVFCTLVRLPLP
jgi:hypothetical protein|tara:strand:+ start:29995 stop:30171 length:177 start_codon:yes stop_codon:yes gene_type:complete